MADEEKKVRSWAASQRAKTVSSRSGSNDSLIRSEHSPGPSRRIVTLLAHAMRDVRVVEIRGAGHMSPLTHAVEVNRHIADFLHHAGAVMRPAA